MRLHRAIGRIAAAVVLALIATMASSYICASRGHYVSHGGKVLTLESLNDRSHTIVMHRRTGSMFLVRAKTPRNVYEQAHGLELVTAVDISSTARWCKDHLERNDLQYVEACGWPLPAFYWERKGRETRGGIGLGQQRSITISQTQSLKFPSLDDHIVPYLPIWRFAICNVALYSGAFLIIFAFLGTGRRHVMSWYRRKRGQCLRCGYDLRHDYSSRCPECGHLHVRVSR